MRKQFQIYVTGDVGEDLFTCTVQGSRLTRPAGSDQPGDTAHDLQVPSGAQFIFLALNSLLASDSVHVELLAACEKDSTNAHELLPLKPILTELAEFSND